MAMDPSPARRFEYQTVRASDREQGRNPIPLPIEAKTARVLGF